MWYLLLQNTYTWRAENEFIEKEKESVKEIFPENPTNNTIVYEYSLH